LALVAIADEGPSCTSSVDASPRPSTVARLLSATCRRPRPRGSGSARSRRCMSLLGHFRLVVRQENRVANDRSESRPVARWDDHNRHRLLWV